MRKVLSEVDSICTPSKVTLMVVTARSMRTVWKTSAVMSGL